MKEIALYIVKALVTKPEEVQIELKEEDTAIVLQVLAAADDLGKLIGKEGKTANAIRTILKNIGGRSNKKVVVKFAENA